MKHLPVTALGRRISDVSLSRRAAPAGVALLLAVAGGAYAAGAGADADAGQDPARAAGPALPSEAARVGTPKRLVLGVAHGPVTTSNATYIDAAPSGPSVGDVRTYYLPLTRRAGSRRIGYLTGTLTTTATSRPAAGKELRTADLVFVVGRAADQIVVGGVSSYAQSAPTIATRSVAIRPVLGGSGTYAGARGWCVSTRRANDTWTHVFHLDLRR